MPTTFGAEEIKLNAISILEGTADPASGLGVARSIGSLYSRALAGLVALSIKTQAAATAWLKLAQSLGWKSVLDYGADATGVVDSTTAFQSALNDQNGLGGGVVFVPFGTYLISQISLSGMVGVQLVGSGASSVLKWTWNAATAAGSMVTLTAGANGCVVSNLRFDGSGLTNPAASRENHLLAIDGTGGGVVETHVDECWFGGMVAASGDGVNISGPAGNLVSRLWIRNSTFDGCSRYGIGHRQGWQYGWICENYLTNCDTEIAFISNASVNSDSIQIFDNEIIHTSASVRWGMRIEGDGTDLYTNLECVKNIVVGGFVTLSNVQYAQFCGNPIFGGAYASADAVLRVFGTLTQALFLENLIDRPSGASAGPCVRIEKSTGAPTQFNVANNNLIQEVSTAPFVEIVDAVSFRVAGNICRATDAGATTAFGIDLQAVSVNLDEAKVSFNQISAAAGTFKAATRLLANGANVLGVAIGNNSANQIDSGAQFEIGGGGGNFTNNVILLGGNTFIANTNTYVNVGGAGVIPRVGFNAVSTTGAQLFEGTGSPEGVVAARPGSMYLNDSGGQGTSVYYKEITGTSGWIGLGGVPLIFGAGDLTTASTAVFLASGYIATAIAAEIKEPLTRPCTIRNLRVQINAAGTGAATVTFTVRKNGVDTVLTCTIANTASGLASDLADKFTAVAGDLISISCTKSAGVAAGQTNAIASVEQV